MCPSWACSSCTSSLPSLVTSPSTVRSGLQDGFSRIHAAEKNINFRISKDTQFVCVCIYICLCSEHGIWAPAHLQQSGPSGHPDPVCACGRAGGSHPYCPCGPLSCKSLLSLALITYSNSVVPELGTTLGVRGGTTGGSAPRSLFILNKYCSQQQMKQIWLMGLWNKFRGCNTIHYY